MEISGLPEGLVSPGAGLGAEYFQALVLYNQAKTQDDKKRYYLAVNAFLAQSMDLAKSALERIPKEERVLAATTVSISRDTSGHFILAELPHGTYTVRVQPPSQPWSAIELPQVRIHMDSLTALDTVVLPNAVPGIFAHWRYD